MTLPTDPRELVRGLMRGDRRLLKVGYTGENATLAACRRLKIEDEADALDLLGYAYGFAYGMADKALPDDDHSAVCESCATTVVREGWNAGQDEDPLRIYPAAGPA